MRFSKCLRQIVVGFAVIFIGPVHASAQCDGKTEGGTSIENPVCPQVWSKMKMSVTSTLSCRSGVWKYDENHETREVEGSARAYCDATLDQDNEEPFCLPDFDPFQYYGIVSGSHHRWTYTARDVTGRDGYVCFRSEWEEGRDDTLTAPGCCSSFCDDSSGCGALDREYQASGCICKECRRNGASCSEDSQCCSSICGNNTNTCGLPTPILLDLSRVGRPYELTSAQSGVMFDIDGDGDLDRIAWTGRDALLGFLALDRNRNGTIDNGIELFGNATPLSDGRTATSGFEALADLDKSQGNGDGMIDVRDPVYDRLLFWTDLNHDGIAQTGELKALAEVGIIRLGTTYREGRRTDRYGNVFRYIGRATVRLKVAARQSQATTLFQSNARGFSAIRR
jgi:hypothetical protein